MMWRRANRVYFSIWMAVINSVLKRANLEDFSSFNFYYNCFEGLFESRTKQPSLEAVFILLDVHKLSLDFKIGMMKGNEKRKSDSRGEEV